VVPREKKKRGSLLASSDVAEKGVGGRGKETQKKTAEGALQDGNQETEQRGRAGLHHSQKLTEERGTLDRKRNTQGQRTETNLYSVKKRSERAACNGRKTILEKKKLSE